MKGIYKGVKYTISQFFVVKEPELEIGGPTDVKHVGHIGCDGPSGGGNPSWMNQYNTGPDFSSTSIGNNNMGSGLSTRSTSKAEDYEDAKQEQEPETCNKDINPSELPAVKKKPRRKKCKPSSCQTSDSVSTTRPSRVAKSKAKLVENKAEPKDIEVA